MSVNYRDQIVFLRNDAVARGLGFGRGATDAAAGGGSTGPRLIAAATLAALAAVAAPAGSFALLDDGRTAVNTDGLATGWRSSSAATRTINDPGNAGAIPVLDSGSVSLVSAGAETRTLAIPTFAGQILNLYMNTDGGDIVVTSAAGINQAANTLITFNDIGDSLVLIGITSGGLLRWRVLQADGVVLA